MRLTQFSDFAVRVMLYLAAHTERLCSVGEIAGAYEISDNHLMKVVSKLAPTGVATPPASAAPTARPRSFRIRPAEKPGW